MEFTKLLENQLTSIYHCSSWWVNQEHRELLEADSDIRSKYVLYMDDFMKSKVVVDIKGKRIRNDTAAFTKLIKLTYRIIEICEKGKLGKYICHQLDQDWLNTDRGFEALCYCNLGHIYGGECGKIPQDLKKAEECFKKADELLGLEDGYSKGFSKAVFKERYHNALNAQINGRTESTILKESVEKNYKINPYPTDPDLRAEAAKGKDK